MKLQEGRDDMPIESERFEECLDDIGCPPEVKAEILEYAENHDIRNCNSNVQHFTEILQIQSINSAKGS